MGTALRYYHLVMMGVWVLLSLYANFAGDFSAYQAARAEQAETDEQP